MNRVFARPYAKALFEIAQESQQLESTAVALSAANEIANHDLMRNLLNQPGVQSSFLAKLFVELGADFFDAKFSAYVLMLAKQKRLNVIADICQIYIELMNEHFGRRRVDVRTAYELSEKDKEALCLRLKKYFNKEIELHVTEDSGLLAGLVIESEDEVIDGSVRGKIDRLNESLLSVV